MKPITLVTAGGTTFRLPRAVLLALTLVLLPHLSNANEPLPTAIEKARAVLATTGVKGGLIVHLGCGDARLTAALQANDVYLVHGLDADPRNVSSARRYVQSLGRYGDVSIDRWDGERLPYVDNLVNLIVSERPIPAPMSEVMRVLVPNGAAYVKTDGKWVKTVKPRSKEIDEWTHYLHDATGNAVGDENVRAGPAPDGDRRSVPKTFLNRIT